MRAFLDTSALVKRYVDEPGSETLALILTEVDELVVSAVCLPECVSAFRRLVREGMIDAAGYAELKGLVLADLADATICHVVPEVLALTVDCLERHPLRTLNALHLACARAVHPDVFVTADRRQAEAARAEGLEVTEV